MRTCKALLLSMLLVLLSSCAPAKSEVVEEVPKITLSEAREFQNHALLELATYVPTDAVVGGMDTPIPQMNGMTCDWAKSGNAASAESGVFLPGGYDIEVSSGVDLHRVLEQIQTDYREKGWQAYWDEGGKGSSMNLISSEGYEFILTALPARNLSQKLRMSSFSPCLRTPEGFTLFDQY